MTEEKKVGKKAEKKDEKEKRSTKKTEYQRYALTLGEQSLLHIGGVVTGNGLSEEGFTVKELFEISKKFPTSQLTLLSAALPPEHRKGNSAGLLLIRGGIDIIMGEKGYADKMLEEQNKMQYDLKFWSSRFKKTLNNKARYKAVFGEKHIDHDEEYKQPNVIGWDEVPLFKKLRAKLPEVFGEKAKDLNAEGNFYYEEKSYIGYHGDTERKIVICCSLGAPATLRFVWREPGSNKDYKGPFSFTVSHSDLYVMSQKCSGYDYKKSSLYRLVHAAGSEKYFES